MVVEVFKSQKEVKHKNVFVYGSSAESSIEEEKSKSDSSVKNDDDEEEEDLPSFGGKIKERKKVPVKDGISQQAFIMK